MSLYLQRKRILKSLAETQGKTVEQIKTIIDSLHEFNPMMGHRGCRLAVTYPEIAKMQTRGSNPRCNQRSEGTCRLGMYVLKS